MPDTQTVFLVDDDSAVRHALSTVLESEKAARVRSYRAWLVTGFVAIGLGAVFVCLCLSAVKSGQFDDLDDPPRRILHDDD